jgi:E3 ubiquitin-protein ligase HUWE1
MLSIFVAIHVMATFVHNEPTSLTVLQEAKLPDSFYQAVENHIEPSIEVIVPIAVYRPRLRF